MRAASSRASRVYRDLLCVNHCPPAPSGSLWLGPGLPRVRAHRPDTRVNHSSHGAFLRPVQCACTAANPPPGLVTAQAQPSAASRITCDNRVSQSGW